MKTDSEIKDMLADLECEMFYRKLYNENKEDDVKLYELANELLNRTEIGFLQYRIFLAVIHMVIIFQKQESRKSRSLTE